MAQQQRQIPPSDPPGPYSVQGIRASALRGWEPADDDSPDVPGDQEEQRAGTPETQMPEVIDLTADDPEELRAQLGFTTFRDFAESANHRPDLTQSLLAALDDPESRDHALAQEWMALARTVVPDTLPDLIQMAQLEPDASPLWEAIGRALRLAAKDPVGIIGELRWTMSPYRGHAADEVLVAMGGEALKQSVAEAGNAYQGPRNLPDEAPLTLASIKNTSSHTQWTPTRNSATRSFKRLVDTVRAELRSQHPTHREWLDALAADPQLKEQRALDRLASALQVLNPDRVCVAALQHGREIGLFANEPDEALAEDLERLLDASRAVGDRAEELQNAIIETMKQRFKRSGSKLTHVAHSRAQDRVRKTIAFLRDLEARHGRLRVVPYAQGLAVHAEMHALTVAVDHPGAALGVSKLCCLQCWLTLTATEAAWPANAGPLFLSRTPATHLTAYQWWPAPSLAAHEAVLANLFRIDPDGRYDDPDTAMLRTAIATPELRSALVNVVSKFERSGEPTDLASSQESPPPLPSFPRRTAAEEAEEADYERYLSDEPATPPVRSVATKRKLSEMFRL